MRGVSLIVANWHSRNDGGRLKPAMAWLPAKTAWYGLFGTHLVVDEHTLDRSPGQEFPSPSFSAL
jgi:hypothetical protein